MNINDALLIADESALRGLSYGNAMGALAAEVRRQSGIIDEQRSTIEALMCGMPEDDTTPVIRRIAAMEQEIERLRADAERYRWLRERVTWSYPSAEGSENKDVYVVITGYGYHYDDDSLVDATIDAAMKDTPT